MDKSFLFGVLYVHSPAETNFVDFPPSRRYPSPRYASVEFASVHPPSTWPGLPGTGRTLSPIFRHRCLPITKKLGRSRNCRSQSCLVWQGALLLLGAWMSSTMGSQKMVVEVLQESPRDVQSIYIKMRILITR
ncbi:hypothetical protein BDV12DRAFT_164610 [Aspergillus spectabilis]